MFFLLNISLAIPPGRQVKFLLGPDHVGSGHEPHPIFCVFRAVLATKIDLLVASFAQPLICSIRVMCPGPTYPQHRVKTSTHHNQFCFILKLKLYE